LNKFLKIHFILELYFKNDKKIEKLLIYLIRIERISSNVKTFNFKFMVLKKKSEN